MCNSLKTRRCEVFKMAAARTLKFKNCFTLGANEMMVVPLARNFKQRTHPRNINTLGFADFDE
jgi:hypothetical protein